MNKAVITLVLLLAVAALGGCRLLRRAAKNTKPPTTDSAIVIKGDTVRPVSRQPKDSAIAVTDTLLKAPADSGFNANNAARIASVLTTYARPLAFQTFSGKAKMHYEGGGENRDFKASIKIEKDKRILINISASAIGINVAQLLITRDSIFLLDLIHHDATIRPVSQVGKLLPLQMDFGMMQHFLTGEALRVDGVPVSSSHTADTLFVNIAGDAFSQQLSFSRTDSTLRQQQYQTLDSTGFAAMLDYNGYRTLRSQRFAWLRSASIFSSGNPYYLEMEFSDAVFDEPVEINFTVPKHYKRK